MKADLAILAGLILVFSTVPYVVDIFRRKTRPNIVTWITWTLLTTIATAAAFAAHQPRTALLTLGSAISTLAVVVAGIKYGIAKFTFFDGLCQAGAIVGLVLWLVFNSPELAIVIVVATDFIGTIPTLRHSWIKPDEETWQTFAVSTLAPILTLFSLTIFSVASMTYPLYLLIGDAAIAAVVVYRRKALGIRLW